MPKFNITVSPDFNPDKIAGWYIFNTWLQKVTGLDIHLELFNSFDEQRDAIKSGKIDLIYANPFDAAMLVRELQFQAIAKPINKVDETVIVTSSDSNINCIEDLPEGTVIAATDDPDINMLGMRMLEPADLDEGNTTVNAASSYIVVAKRLMNEDAQVGFFLKEAFDDLSNVVRSKLKVLVTSEISVIFHGLMIAPSMLQHKDLISNMLLNMADDAKGPGVLEALGLQGWEDMGTEDVEFMIDLMETLRD